MAVMLRNENNLLTLRCNVGVAARKPVLITQGFIGSDPVGDPLQTKLQDLGYSEQSYQPSAVGDISGAAGQLLSDQLTSLNDAADPSEPLWIQIGQDSYQAALLGWEEMAGKATNRSVLRIPNFLRNPYRPKRNCQFAICTSAPMAKGAPDVASEAMILIGSLQEGLTGSDHRAMVDVFPDYSDVARLKSKTKARKADWPNLDVTVHDPEQMKSILGEAPRTREIGAQAQVQNPWLRWILAHYRQTGVDAVHFICPGYQSEGSGALALAPSPLANQDQSWARFVGMPELNSFYNMLGCAIMGFTATGFGYWHSGIHALAYELSWARPGPVIVGKEAGSSAQLASIYGAILQGQGMDRAVQSDIPCYLHPDIAKLQQGLDADEGFLAPLPDDEFGVDSGAVIKFSSRKGFEGGGLEEGPFGGFDDGLEGAMPPPDTRQGLPSSQPHPERDLMGRILENERARIASVKMRSEVEQHQDLGASNALDFLQEVLKQ